MHVTGLSISGTWKKSKLIGVGGFISALTRVSAPIFLLNWILAEKKTLAEAAELLTGGAVVQQQDLPAAAGSTCSNSMLQKHAAASSRRSNKQHHAPTSRSAVYPALLGTRCNQHHHEKIALVFVVLFVRDQAQQMKYKNQTNLLFQILAGRYIYCCSPMSTLDANRLRISHNHHQASSSLSSTATTKARFNREQGVVAAKIRLSLIHI